MSMDGYLPPGVEHADVDRAIEGPHPIVARQRPKPLTKEKQLLLVQALMDLRRRDERPIDSEGE